LTKIMQNGKSLFCMRISHAKRLVYNGMRKPTKNSDIGQLLNGSACGYTRKN